MREILFRGKRTDNGEWIEGYYVNINNFHYIYTGKTYKGYIYDVSERFKVEQENVCQYTNLKDKNGTKIFEGDLIYIPKEDEYAAIKWDNDEARFYIDRDDIYSDFDNYYGSELEVIGNIFDNKDLLGGE